MLPSNAPGGDFTLEPYQARAFSPEAFPNNHCPLCKGWHCRTVSTVNGPGGLELDVSRTRIACQRCTDQQPEAAREAARQYARAKGYGINEGDNEKDIEPKKAKAKRPGNIRARSKKLRNPNNREAFLLNASGSNEQTGKRIGANAWRELERRYKQSGLFDQD